MSTSVLDAPLERKIITARMEKALRQPVLMGHLGPAIENALMPFMSRVSSALQDTDTTVFALVELLFAKGVITREELDAKEQDVNLRLHQQLEEMQQRTEGSTSAKAQPPRDAQPEPSPADVARRLEQLGQPVAESETLPRQRLVEG